MGISATPYPAKAKATEIIDDGPLSLAAISTDLLTADHIAEKTAAHNVVLDNTIEGTTAKHDHIAEKTGAHNIVFDNSQTNVSSSVVIASASGTLRKSNDAEVTTTSANWALKKTIAIPVNHVPGGVYRIAYDHKVTADQWVNSRLAIHGVGITTSLYGGTLLGTEQATQSATYENVSQDVTILQGGGEVIELWMNASGGATGTIRNLRIYCTETTTTGAW